MRRHRALAVFNNNAAAEISICEIKVVITNILHLDRRRLLLCDNACSDECRDRLEQYDANRQARDDHVEQGAIVESAGAALLLPPEHCVNKLHGTKYSEENGVSSVSRAITGHEVRGRSCDEDARGQRHLSMDKDIARLHSRFTEQKQRIT